MVASALVFACALALIACQRQDDESFAPATTVDRSGIESEVPATESLHLQSGVPLAFTIGPGGSMADLALERGQALVITADQRLVDVILEIQPSGSEPLEVDLPTKQTMPERLCFIAEDAGLHKFFVRTAIAGLSASTEIEAQIRQATSTDHSCASALATIVQAQALEAQGDAENAYAFYRQAVALARDAQDSVLEAAALFLSIDVAIERSAPTALADAIRDGEAALDRIVGHGLPMLGVLLQQSMGDIERIRGKLDKARQRFLASAEQAEQIDDLPGLARAHTGLGRIAEVRAELATAAAAYGRALELWQRVDRPTDHAFTLVQLATVHTMRSELVEARDRVDEAERILPAGETTARLYVYVQAGWIDFLAKRYDSALAFYEQALALLDPSKDSLSRGGILDRMATAERGRGNLARAESLYQEVLEIYRYARGASFAITSFSLGDLYLEQGRLHEARPYLERAIADLHELGDDNTLAHALASLADLERASGNLTAALRQLEAAAERFEARWREAFRQGELARPTALVEDIDSKYVDLLMELAEIESSESMAQRAFTRSDAARDHNLLAMIGAGVGRTGNPTAAEAATQSRLREEIERLEMRRADSAESAATGVRTIEAEIRRLQGQLNATQGDIRSRVLDPASAPAPFEVAQLQKELPPKTCVLSYVLGKARSFLFFVCKDTFERFSLPPRDALEAQARTVLAALSHSDQRGTEEQAFFMLQSTTDRLLGPVAARLDDVERLVVVAEGTLAHLPFAVLPHPTTLRADDAPLLSRFDVVQGPSVGVLAALAQRAATRPERRSPIVVFADPVYSKHDRRFANRSSTLGSAPTLGSSPTPGSSPTRHRVVSGSGALRFWERLPATRNEALAIRSFAPEAASVRLGFEANRRAVLDGALENAAIIHFATHGELDEDVPTSSGLVLSQLDDRGRLQPSHLRIRDIQALTLSADLVVLSACHSAWGKPIRGDALIGLAQAFFVAGASRVLVSLWPVDDQATAALMETFYFHLLREDAHPATALRLAQMKIRATPGWQAPFFWAGFALLDGWR